MISNLNLLNFSETYVRVEVTVEMSGIKGVGGGSLAMRTQVD